jgi:glycosyltransferase involved in cell wall biosynthesis
VVVPTRDRPVELARCLAALRAQREPGELEIVVADDGSVDADRVGRVAAAAGARLVRIESRGPAAARNAGARAANGRVVCFTDDDCEPDPDWSVRLAAALASGPSVVAGRTEAAGADPYSAATEAIVRELGRRAAFVASNNVACVRGVVLEVPFDERFPAAAGEDRDWSRRVVAAGFRLAREPRAVIHHRTAPGLAGFWRRHVRYGRGAYRFAERGGGRLPARFYAGLVRAGFARGPTIGTLVLVAQLATAVGYVRERAG